MGIPIRIGENIYNEAKKVANPDLPTDFIKDVLLSKLQDESLAEPFQFES